MRFLHPIAAHERFVARGTYRLFSLGQQVEVYAYEHWTIHEVGDGGQFIRIDHAPLRGGVNQLMEAFRSPRGEIERFDVRRWLTEVGQAKHEASVSVIREAPDRALLMRRINHAEVETLEAPLAEHAILLPQAMLLLADYTLHGMRRATAFVLNTGANLFSPLMETISAQYEADETLSLGKQTVETRRYLVTNEARDERFIIWLDRHNVPLRTTRPPETPIAELFNYAHR